MSTPRTLAELAQESLDIQTASNLSGLVHGWSRSISELRVRLEESGITDTDAINQHPINKLWADKVADLTRSRGDADFSRAYSFCERLAKPGPA